MIKEIYDYDEHNKCRAIYNFCGEDNTSNRAQIHDIMRKEEFTGQTLNIDAIKRLGARVTKANISFDDQPFGDRMNNKIVTVTYDNMIAYLSQKGWLVKTLYINN